jgi:phage terminase small subunit
MTAKQSLFVQEYQVDYNATKAAIRAGYSAKTAQEQGSRLLSNVMVQAVLTEAHDARRRASEVTLERLDRETSILATSDLRRMMRAGEWVPLQDIPDDLAPAVAGIEVLFKAGEDGEPPQKLMKIRLWDKPSALKLLYQRRGSLTDNKNLNVKGELSLKAQEAMIESMQRLPTEVLEAYDTIARQIGVLRKQQGDLLRGAGVECSW